MKIEDAKWFITIQEKINEVTKDKYCFYTAVTLDNLIPTNQDLEDDGIMEIINKGGFTSNKFDSQYELFSDLGHSLLTYQIRDIKIENKLED